MKEWSGLKKSLVGVFSVSIAMLALYGGRSYWESAFENLKAPMEARSSANSLSGQPASNSLPRATERVIFNGVPPYLSKLPILDNSLYLMHDNNAFLLGGTNIHLIYYSAWKRIGGTATIREREDAIEFEMAEQPYIEFSYGGKFYSVEVSSRLYSYRMQFRELAEATIELNRKFGDAF